MLGGARECEASGAGAPTGASTAPTTSGRGEILFGPRTVAPQGCIILPTVLAIARSDETLLVVQLVERPGDCLELGTAGVGPLVGVVVAASPAVARGGREFGVEVASVAAAGEAGEV